MNLGFIGCGNMAKAIMKGIIGSEAESTESICGSNASEAHAAAVAEEFGIKTTTDNLEVVRKSDVIFLCV